MDTEEWGDTNGMWIANEKKLQQGTTTVLLELHWEIH